MSVNHRRTLCLRFAFRHERFSVKIDSVVFDVYFLRRIVVFFTPTHSGKPTKCETQQTATIATISANAPTEPKITAIFLFFVIIHLPFPPDKSGSLASRFIPFANSLIDFSTCLFFVNNLIVLPVFIKAPISAS